MEEIIRVEEASFCYDEGLEGLAPALKNINLSIKEGEFIAILGHNGSGKSTLAKLLNALLIPTSGRVLVDNLSTEDPETLWSIRQTAGMVFQNPDNQIVATTVEEDVAFGPENLGQPSNLIRERVDEALNLIGIYDLKDRPPHQLSGGQKQKVAIAGVIAMRPRCLILDEPTALLDPGGRREVMETVKKLNRDEKVSVVFITHFMEEAIHADRILVLEKGQVVMEGTPREIFPQVNQLRKLGLDVPQVTELALQLREEGLKLSGDILEIEELVNGLCSLK